MIKTFHKYNIHTQSENKIKFISEFFAVSNKHMNTILPKVLFCGYDRQKNHKILNFNVKIFRSLKFDLKYIFLLFLVLTIA